MAMGRTAHKLAVSMPKLRFEGRHDATKESFRGAQANASGRMENRELPEDSQHFDKYDRLATYCPAPLSPAERMASRILQARRKGFGREIIRAVSLETEDDTIVERYTPASRNKPRTRERRPKTPAEEMAEKILRAKQEEFEKIMREDEASELTESHAPPAFLRYAHVPEKQHREPDFRYDVEFPSEQENQAIPVTTRDSKRFESHAPPTFLQYAHVPEKEHREPDFRNDVECPSEQENQAIPVTTRDTKRFETQDNATKMPLNGIPLYIIAKNKGRNALARNAHSEVSNDFGFKDKNVIPRRNPRVKHEKSMNLADGMSVNTEVFGDICIFSDMSAVISVTKSLVGANEVYDVDEYDNYSTGTSKVFKSDPLIILSSLAGDLICSNTSIEMCMDIFEDQVDALENVISAIPKLVVDVLDSSSKNKREEEERSAERKLYDSLLLDTALDIHEDIIKSESYDQLVNKATQLSATMMKKTEMAVKLTSDSAVAAAHASSMAAISAAAFAARASTEASRKAAALASELSSDLNIPPSDLFLAIHMAVADAFQPAHDGDLMGRNISSGEVATITVNMECRDEEKPRLKETLSQEGELRTRCNEVVDPLVVDPPTLAPDTDEAASTEPACSDMANGMTDVVDKGASPAAVSEMETAEIEAEVPILDQVANGPSVQGTAAYFKEDAAAEEVTMVAPEVEHDVIEAAVKDTLECVEEEASQAVVSEMSEMETAEIEAEVPILDQAANGPSVPGTAAYFEEDAAAEEVAMVAPDVEYHVVEGTVNESPVDDMAMHVEAETEEAIEVEEMTIETFEKTPDNAILSDELDSVEESSSQTADSIVEIETEVCSLDQPAKEPWNTEGEVAVEDIENPLKASTYYASCSYVANEVEKSLTSKAQEAFGEDEAVEVSLSQDLCMHASSSIQANSFEIPDVAISMTGIDPFDAILANTEHDIVADFDLDRREVLQTIQSVRNRSGGPELDFVGVDNDFSKLKAFSIISHEVDVSEEVDNLEECSEESGSSTGKDSEKTGNACVLM
jgi:hypothetical protein